MNVNDKQIKEILEKYKKITVIGISKDAGKPSQRIPVYMRGQGYEVVGVNPTVDEVDGIKIYKSLKDVPADFRKFVDVFRRPEHIPAVVGEVLAAGGVEVLWLQLGITHPEAEKNAEKNKIQVVSDRCLLIEHKKYFRKENI